MQSGLIGFLSRVFTRCFFLSVRSRSLDWRLRNFLQPLWGICLKDNALPGDGKTLTPLFGDYFSSGLQTASQKHSDTWHLTLGLAKIPRPAHTGLKSQPISLLVTFWMLTMLREAGQKCAASPQSIDKERKEQEEWKQTCRQWWQQSQFIIFIEQEGIFIFLYLPHWVVWHWSFVMNFYPVMPVSKCLHCSATFVFFLSQLAPPSNPCSLFILCKCHLTSRNS